MRGFLILLIVFSILTQCPAQAALKDFLWKPKDYKQMFLNDAYNAEKRNNHKSAFHSYEKAMYYYSKDERVIASYAAFCERNNYLDKAQQLYLRIYVLTKKNQYLFKSNLVSIKNGKLSEEQIKNILKDKKLSPMERSELAKAQIAHFAYYKKWNKVKDSCDNIPLSALSQDIIFNCIFASQKSADTKGLLRYYSKFVEINPKDSSILHSAIKAAQRAHDDAAQEKFIKQLIKLNPSDNGIKYQLAGFYEKTGQWRKSLNVYEGLMASGDLSSHVKNSYTYVLSQLDRKNHPEKIEPSRGYFSRPLSAFQINEKRFYDAWGAKNYKQAQKYLALLLKSEPKNPKLLRHKVDIDFSQGEYLKAIDDMQNLSNVAALSLEDKKYIAFLYSKSGDNEKAREQIENLLASTPEDEPLLNLALQYSMAGKNWDSALFYSGKILEKHPDDIKLLKAQMDLYSIKQDFKNAANIAKRLVEIEPNLENKMSLANFYMAAKEFDLAYDILEPLYKEYRDNPKIVKAYLNSLLAQQKTHAAYKVIRENNLEQSKEGYTVLGDLNLRNKMYDTAANYYFKALNLDPENPDIKNNLALSYRMLGYRASADKLYSEVLAQYPDNPEAQLGLGSLEIDRKNFKEARQVFYKILQEKPDYRPAKIAMAHSYIANGEKMRAIEILQDLEPDDETTQMIGQAYYDMNMPIDAKRVLKGNISEDAQKLKYQIRRDEAITFTPSYSIMISQLADEFNLDYFKYGIAMAKRTKGNANVFAEYNNIVYSSGNPYYLTNVTNEVKAGVQARPNKKWEYRADLGVRAFQFDDGALIVTDSWIKRYFNDSFNLKAGVKRINIEQSYLSAVGEYVDGVLTGRSADNKFYLEYEAKLPKQFYSFGRFAYGVINSQNLTTNQYLEGYVGVGKAVYDNPKNEWLQRVSIDLVSYNASWQYNQLEIYNSVGTLYGGYFSPGYFNATTLQVKLEGKIKKLNNLRYGVSGFGGIQNAITPDMTSPTWGYSPYIAYDINDHISINASYNHYNYADIQRDYFMFYAVIRGFKKYVKS